MATLRDMIVEVHDQLGQVTDLDVYLPDGSGFDENLELEGTRRIAEWLNRGLRRVCSWKFPDGQIMRFPSLFRQYNFKAGPIEIPVDAIDGAEVTVGDFVDTDVDIEATNPRLWILEIEDQRRVVMRRDGNVLTVDKAYEDGTLLTGGTVYKREWRFVDAISDAAHFEIPLNPITEIEAVQRITQIDNGRQLHRALSTDYYPIMIGKIGEPTAYYSLSSSLIFDIAPKEPTWYQLEYYAMPSPMLSQGDQPEIPEPFHEAIILYATWIGLRRYQEWNGAYSTKRDITDFMRTIRSSYSMNNELEEGYLFIDDGGFSV